MDLIKSLLTTIGILCYLLNVNGQEINDHLVYSIYFNGVIVEELLKDQKINQLTVQEDDDSRTEYSINRRDSSILLLVKYGDKRKLNLSYEITYDPEFNLLKQRFFEDSEDLDHTEETRLYERKSVGDENHEFTYLHKVLKDGSISQRDTFIKIKRHMYSNGDPIHVKEKFIIGHEVTEREKYFLYDFDEEGRLIKKSEYNGNQDLTDVTTYEFLDEQGIVNVTLNNRLYKLFFKDDKLKRSEIHGYSGLNSYRTFEYNKRGRLIKLTEFDKNGVEYESYSYRYK